MIRSMVGFATVESLSIICMSYQLTTVVSIRSDVWPSVPGSVAGLDNGRVWVWRFCTTVDEYLQLSITFLDNQCFRGDADEWIRSNRFQ